MRASLDLSENPQIDVYYGPKNVFMFVGERIATTNFVAIDNENGGSSIERRSEWRRKVGDGPLV
jgi:hypothetical protein